MSEEWVDLVNDADEVVGRATRREVRSRNLPHRGIGLIVFNSRGQVYVHQRTSHKDLFPSLFDMFIGGVVAAGESYEEAARREAAEELGVTSELDYMFDHLYKGERNYAWIRAFRTVWDGPIVHQPSEVAWGDWMDADRLEAWCQEVEIVPDGLEVFHRYLAWREGR